MSKGKYNKFEVRVLGTRGSCAGKVANEEYQQAVESLEDTFTIGLHKRGRSYHVSMGLDDKDGEPLRYETDKLTSLRLPGKALAIVVGKRDKADGETQALIDSIEITRVSE